MASKIDTSKYNESYVGALLGMALVQLYSRDYYLIENGVAERAITHRLAVYLERLFFNYHVDCEYNRMSCTKETVEIIANFEKEILCACGSCDKDGKECEGRNRYNKSENGIYNPYVFPDIIVHRRGNDDSNLLIIEAKKNFVFFCRKGVEFDNCKLKSYKNDLGYIYAAFIPFEDSLEYTLQQIKFYVKNEDKLKDEDKPHHLAFIQYYRQAVNDIDSRNYKAKLKSIQSKIIATLTQKLRKRFLPFDFFMFFPDKSDAMAQCGLGICYDIGDGVAQNFDEAKNLYFNAAEQGNADAQFLLGEWYRMGRCVAQNITEATKLYRKASEQGHPNAIMQLQKMGKRS